MFRLKSIKNQEKENILVNLDEELNGVNYYTIITGENGCGKSSLLSKAINTFIFDNSQKSSECVTDIVSERIPSRVIAICNARYNKFASMKTYFANSKVYYPHFYIQNDHNLEVSRFLQSVMQSVLRESIIINGRRDLYDKWPYSHVGGIRNAFRMIGIEPVMDLKLEFNNSYINAIKRVLLAQERGEPFSEQNYGPQFRDFSYWRKISGIQDDLLKELFEVYEALKKRPNALGNVEIHIDTLGLGIKTSNLPDYLIFSGLATGFIIPAKVQVQRNSSLKWVSIHSLSSGQQAMMVNAIIISVFAQENSLICIDEPENSLHPEWQLDYMSFINYLCPEDIGCHFLIATHSPQIISGMKSVNGCVVSLIDKEKQTHNYSEENNHLDGIFRTSVQEIHSISSFLRQSADRQLVDVFKSPGFGNESLIHRLMLILTKLTKKIQLKPDDRELIKEISWFIRSDKIDQDDPAVVIYKQIIAFIKQRESND